MHIVVSAKVTFEKMTNRDFAGTTYYTIRNVSLYECLGWCRDEVDCSSASFSFVVNPLAPLQETTCRLQNETQTAKSPPGLGSNSPAVGPSANPQKAVNLYYFSKSHLRSGRSSGQRQGSADERALEVVTHSRCCDVMDLAARVARIFRIIFPLRFRLLFHS